MSDNEVLVVASKIKTYIKNSGDMKTLSGTDGNTGDGMMTKEGPGTGTTCSSVTQLRRSYATTQRTSGKLDFR